MERSLPPRPVRPEPPPPSAPQGGFSSWITIVLALGLGMFVLTGLGAVLFAAFGVSFPIFAVGGIFAFAGFHYVLWGWWLGGMIRRDAEREEAERAENAKSPPGE